MGMKKVLGLLVVVVFIISCDINQIEKDSFTEISDGGISLLPESGSEKFIISDLVNNVVKGKASEAVSWSEIESVIESAKAQTSRDLVAVFSVRDSTGSWYNYYVQPLGFSPGAVEESGGETQLFIYELEPDSLSSVPRIAVASIPKGDQAYSEMEAWIHPQIENQVHNKLIDLNSNYIQDDLYCDYQEVVPGGTSCSTWGGVTECTYYFPIYDTVCYGGSDGSSIWNWPSNGGGSNDGSGSGNCEPPYFCGTPEEADVEDDSEVIDLTDLDLVDVFMGDIIIHESILNDQKVKCTLDKLLNNGNTLAETILKFADQSLNIDLVIELASLPVDINGQLVSSNISNTFRLQINSNSVTDRIPIQIATTIMHEAIHAEMRRYLYGATDVSTLSNFPGSFADDWNHYVNTRYGRDVGSAEHDAMANSYINTIANGLMQFDGNELSTSEYIALAWNGLTNTQAYINLSLSQKNQLGLNYQSAINSSNTICN